MKECAPQTAPISLLWQAARCSSAAPVFFESFVLGKMVFVDGGFRNNNPTLQALTECTNLIRHLNRNRDETRLEGRIHLRLVLSLGCSFQKPELRSAAQINDLSHIHPEYEWYHYYRYIFNIFRVRGAAMLVQMMKNSAFDATSGVDEAVAWSSGLGAVYTRYF